MRRRGVDRLAGLGRVGEVDAAELEQVSRRGDLRRRMIDACNPAPRASASSTTTLPSAPSAPVTTMTFPSMKGLRLPGNGSAAYQEFFTGNAANFCMERSVSRAQIAAGCVCAAT